ncbi:twin-arginine translocation signal domain-containing protein [Streptomyces sp. NPDC002514]|uniref:twin-arginine translocation signal domain-containing protein n=1 Tax=Streptomyces sp. NPDC001270 TaxID=3364554 RepID=UPI0036C3F891
MGSFTRRKFIGRLAVAGAAVAAGPVVAASVAAATPAQGVETWEFIGKDVFTGDAESSRGQGVTTDGTHWYFSSTNGLEITDMQYNTLFKSSPAIPSELADPSPLAHKGLNHIGDIDYANGKLYISLDTSTRDAVTGSRYDTPVFAVYNAADLSFTGQAAALNPPHGVQDIASWVAVDARKGLAYGMAYDNATEIAVYNLRDWTFNRYIPLSQTIDQAQGGKIHDDWMYFASDDAGKNISRANLTTGEVQVLFDLKVPYDQEVEGLSFLETRDGLTLSILNREQPDPNGPGNVTFYHYRLKVTGTPVIKGSPKVGGYVTADPGKWVPAAKFSYQWLVNGEPVAGANRARFHLVGKYLHDTVTVRVTGTWADGTSGTVESGPVTVVSGS